MKYLRRNKGKEHNRKMEKESEYAGRLMSYETQKAFRKKFLKN